MYNAIYYKDEYYLLPANCCNYDMFIRDIAERDLPAEFSMIHLLENHRIPCYSVIKGESMAPYFLSGYHDEPVSVSIEDPADVYPAKVELMDQDEYNSRLRKVIERVCPGCLRFKPLSNRVQSLNGHFEEMTLDGVCLFRQEVKPAPRIFRDGLFCLGGSFTRYDYALCCADEMIDHIKCWTHIRYATADIQDGTDGKSLIVSCKKKELLTPIITKALSRYLAKISEETYHICLTEDIRLSEDRIAELLSDNNIEVFRKECKKYGVSLAIIEYTEDAAEKVRMSLEGLIENFFIFPLVQLNGREYYLVFDTSQVLKAFRYRSPLLQFYDAKVSIYDGFKSTRYTLSYSMEQNEI